MTVASATSPRADALVTVPLALRVLVVDDNRDSADSMAMLLGMFGADVRACYDGATALQLAGDFVPNVGVLDVNMPIMDGCELARRLRDGSTGRPLLLVAVTGIGTAVARERTAAAGFDLHFDKPADPAALAATLSDFLHRLRHGSAG